MTSAALIYLGLPASIYLIAFVKPAFGWPLLIALALGLHRLLRSRCQVGPRRGSRAPWPSALPPLAVAGAVVALMGFGTGHFNWDWIKHWALLNTLESEPWPVQLTLQGEPAHLRFYLGAYLVPAGLAHLTGWSVVPWTALWWGLGLALALSLFCRNAGEAGRRPWLVAPLLLAMAGADAWLQLLLRSGTSPITFTGFHHEWWANALLDHALQYTAPLTALLWVPHQAVPVFIGTGLIMSIRRPADLWSALLAISLLALWSPYGLIGAFPLLMVKVLAIPELRCALKSPGLTGWSVGLFAAAFVVLMAWTLSHELQTGGLCLRCAPARIAQPEPYLLFLLVELLVPLLVLRRRLLDDAPSKVAVLTLILLPWIGGPVPDAVMRISMPALIYLFVRCARHVAALDAHQLIAASIAVLVISGPTVWGELSFHFEAGTRHAALPPRDPLAAPSYVTWARRTTYTSSEFFDVCGWQWRSQYFSPSPPPTWPDQFTPIAH